MRDVMVSHGSKLIPLLIGPVVKDVMDWSAMQTINFTVISPPLGVALRQRESKNSKFRRQKSDLSSLLFLLIFFFKLPYLAPSYSHPTQPQPECPERKPVSIYQPVPPAFPPPHRKPPKTKSFQKTSTSKSSKRHPVQEQQPRKR